MHWKKVITTNQTCFSTDFGGQILCTQMHPLFSFVRGEICTDEAMKVQEKRIEMILLTGKKIIIDAVTFF